MRHYSLSDADHLNNIADEDFCNVRFDAINGVKPDKLLLLFSTPRSGSTMLCEVFYRSGVCLPHEYFHQKQYMKLLAGRWGCYENGKLNLDYYVSSLFRHRTSGSGWIGINLHAMHIDAFDSVWERFDGMHVKAVHLMRRDVVAQAISYYVALNSGQWSKHFNKIGDVIYDYDGISHIANSIGRRNTLIQSYCLVRGIELETVFYEDLITDRAESLDFVRDFSLKFDSPDMSIIKQSELKKVRMKERFCEEFYAKGGKYRSPKMTLLSRILKVFG